MKLRFHKDILYVINIYYNINTTTESNGTTRIYDSYQSFTKSNQVYMEKGIAKVMDGEVPKEDDPRHRLYYKVYRNLEDRSSARAGKSLP